jgi:hypothetical protein
MHILQRTIRYALTAAQVHTEAGPTKAFAELLLLNMCWFQKSTDEHAWVHLSFWQIRPITDLLQQHLVSTVHVLGLGLSGLPDATTLINVSRPVYSTLLTNTSLIVLICQQLQRQVDGVQ